MFETWQILGSRGPTVLGPTVRMALAGLCAMGLLALAGCGQKGLLYLPDAQTTTTPPQAHGTHNPQR